MSQQTIEEIKVRTDLVDLISSYGIAVKRAGASYKACCPFHHEKTPSFNIQPDKGFYHCFGCGVSGDAIKFVQEHEGLSFMEAVRKLAQACGVKIEETSDPEAGLRARLYAMNAELAAFFRRCLLRAGEAARARDYLASRDIPDDVAERFGIGYVPVGAAPMLAWAAKHGFTAQEMIAGGALRGPRPDVPGDRPYNQFGGRLSFAIRDRMGRTVGFSCRTLETDKAKMRGGKYVNTPETPVFKKSRVLYALDLAAGEIVKAPRREAIVCEGQIDVIRCHACGFRTAVAGEGTAFTPEHVQLLKKCADSAVLVFDGDAAGCKAAVRTGGEFLAAGLPVRVATLPPGEDPDSLLSTHGPQAFRDCLDAAESITAFQVRVLRGQEAHPDSIDAVTRVSRAALATVARCTSAVMRAALLEDAARLLHLPVSALEEDFARLRDAAPARVPPRLAPPSATAAPADEPADAPPSQDAAAPDNNPPPPCEFGLCGLLCDRLDEGAALRPLVDAHVPDEILAHPFTRRFLAAWRTAVQDGTDLIEARAGLSDAEKTWFDRLILANDRSGQSELSPETILKKELLRNLWIAYAERRRGALPAGDDAPETVRLRLTLSSHIKRLRLSPWPAASALMDLSQYV